MSEVFRFTASRWHAAEEILLRCGRRPRRHYEIMRHEMDKPIRAPQGPLTAAPTQPLRTSLALLGNISSQREGHSGQ